jgi:hypothetical protein
MNIEAVIEQLECAKINCDNVKTVGPKMAEFVKIQIQDAIQMLIELDSQDEARAASPVPGAEDE